MSAGHRALADAEYVCIYVCNATGRLGDRDRRGELARQQTGWSAHTDSHTDRETRRPVLPVLVGPGGGLPPFLPLSTPEPDRKCRAGSGPGAYVPDTGQCCSALPVCTVDVCRRAVHVRRSDAGRRERGRRRGREREAERDGAYRWQYKGGMPCPARPVLSRLLPSFDHHQPGLDLLLLLLFALPNSLATTSSSISQSINHHLSIYLINNTSTHTKPNTCRTRRFPTKHKPRGTRVAHADKPFLAPLFFSRLNTSPRVWHVADWPTPAPRLLLLLLDASSRIGCNEPYLGPPLVCERLLS